MLTPLHSEAITDDYIEYVKDTSRFFNVNDCIIFGIITQEGGTPGIDTVHSNGSIDSGLAQIQKNGEWMRHFAEHYQISSEQIRDNPYLSILLVGYILRTERDRSTDMIDAISAYHRGFGNRQTARGIEYARKVIKWGHVWRVKGVCRALL